MILSDTALSNSVLMTSILTERGVLSLGLQAHRAVRAGAAAGKTNGAGAGAAGKKAAGDRGMVGVPGAGPGAGPGPNRVGDVPRGAGEGVALGLEEGTTGP